MSEIVFFVSSTGVITLVHMKKSYEITLVGNSGIGYWRWCLGHCSRQQDHLRGFLSLFIFPAHPSLLLFTSFPQRSMWHDALFLFTALFVCAFFVRDRTSTTMHGTSRSASRCRTFGVTTHSKLIRMSSISIWVCHTSHEVNTPWMSRSCIHDVGESIASRSGARFVQGVRCTDL